MRKSRDEEADYMAEVLSKVNRKNADLFIEKLNRSKDFLREMREWVKWCYPDTWDDDSWVLKNLTLGFGQFKGRYISEVISLSPRYYLWLLATDDARDKIPAPLDDLIVRFKHDISQLKQLGIQHDKEKYFMDLRSNLERKFTLEREEIRLQKAKKRAEKRALRPNNREEKSSQRRAKALEKSKRDREARLESYRKIGKIS